MICCRRWSDLAGHWLARIKRLDFVVGEVILFNIACRCELNNVFVISKMLMSLSRL